jgi:hypothetical protein
MKRTYARPVVNSEETLEQASLTCLVTDHNNLFMFIDNCASKKDDVTLYQCIDMILRTPEACSGQILS